MKVELIVPTVLLSVPLMAQSLTDKTPEIPRTPDGKPDLSGIWQASGGPHKPPFHFLGWNYAHQRGGQYLRRFTRSGAGLSTPIAKTDPPAPQSVAIFTGGEVPSAISSSALPPAAGFQSRDSLPTGFVPTSVAVGDFNRDGHQDWVVANGVSNDLWLYLGKGDGTSSLPTIIPLSGQSPLWVVAADLRKIGTLDLVVAEADSDSVEVLLGNGDGTFGGRREHCWPKGRCSGILPGGQYSVPGSPLLVQVADFNGDGIPDILVGLNATRNPGSLVVLRGDGAGHFLPPKPVPPVTTVPPVIPLSMAAMDLNGDGYPDVLVADGHSGYASVYLNRKDGTFEFSQTIYRGINGAGIIPLGVALGDLNGDRCADAIVTDTLGAAWEYFGNCDGTFKDLSSQVPFFGAGDSAMAIALADLNHDGKLDLVTAGFVVTEDIIFGQNGGNMLTVRFGDGQGNFGVSHVYRGAPFMVALAVADLRGTGYPDVITANQDNDSATIFNNDGSGGFDGAQGGCMSTAPYSNFVPIDVNGDGKTDLVLLDSSGFGPDPFQLIVFLNDGAGNFGPPAQYPAVDSRLPIGDFKLADLRNTGRPDFVAIGNQYSTGVPFISFAPNNGNGTYGPAVLTRVAHAQGIFGVGDFDGDGKLDLAIAAGDGFCPTSPACLTIFLGNGDGTFHEGFSAAFNSQGSSASYPGAIYIGDFNRDGKQDVLVWITSTLEGTLGKDVFEFLGNGDGTFQPGVDTLRNFAHFAVADLNHDGIPDLVEMVEAETTVTTGTPAFAIWLGQGDGTFKMTNTYRPYAGEFGLGYFFGDGIGPRRSPLVADFNGDGNPDIAVFQQVPGVDPVTFFRQTYLQILLGNGDGTFTPSYNKTEFHQLRVPTTAVDVDGVGRADLVELDGFSRSFNVLRAVPGAAFGIAMKSNPVPGTAGALVLSLSIPSPAPATISLSASDPHIILPASATVPAGAISLTVPFQISCGFNPDHVFSIQANLGNEIEITYGTQASGNIRNGFSISAVNSTESAIPGSVALDCGLRLAR